MLATSSPHNVIPQGEILQRIAVRPPYFSLQNVHRVAPRTLQAELPCEHPRDGELTPMTAAEVGRHLAILGSCAAAMTTENGSRPSFYLASRARLRSVDTEMAPAPAADRFLGTAEVVQSSSSSVRVSAFVDSSTHGRLKNLDVDYKVLPLETFRSIFDEYRTDLRRAPRPLAPIEGEEVEVARRLRRNPYQTFIPLYGITIRGDTLTCSAGRVHPDFCGGHFPMFPSLPVAIYLNTLKRGAYHLLRHLVGGQPRYAIVDVDMESRRLVFAGEPFAMSISARRPRPPVYEFDCRATSGNVEVGRMQLQMVVRSTSPE